eukprot:9493453-Pyramimonas_sp.AAC.1
MLSLASLTEPGHVAKNMRGVDLQATSEAKTMIDKPESMAKLKSWLVAEVLAGHNIRSEKRGAAAPAAAEAPAVVSALVFSDSDDEATP